jgi:hypothetical protein
MFAHIGIFEQKPEASEQNIPVLAVQVVPLLSQAHESPSLVV